MNSSTQFCTSLRYQISRISVQLEPRWFVRTDIQSDGEMDWHDGSNGRFSRTRSLVKSTRQSVEMFKEPWDLNSSDVFPLYGGLLLSGNAVQEAVALSRCQASAAVKSSWNVMAHGEAREEKWRGNKKMEWVTSKRHMTAEHRLARAVQTLQASSRLNWRPHRLNGLVRFSERRNLVSAHVPWRFKRNLQLNTLLFWDVTRPVLVFVHWNFGTTYMGRIGCPKTSATSY